MIKKIFTSILLGTLATSLAQAAEPTPNMQAPTPNNTPVTTPVQSNTNWNRQGKYFVNASLSYNFIGIQPSQIIGNSNYDNGDPAYPNISSVMTSLIEVRYGITERIMLGASYEILNYKNTTNGTTGGLGLSSSNELSSNHLGIHGYYYFIANRTLSAYVGGALRFYNPLYHYEKTPAGGSTIATDVKLPVNLPFEAMVGTEYEFLPNIFLVGQFGFRFTNFNNASGNPSITGFDISGPYLTGGVGTYF
jgi:hypothetical protein